MTKQSNGNDAIHYYRRGDEFLRNLIARQAPSSQGVRKFCVANGVACSTFPKRHAMLAESGKLIRPAEVVTTPNTTFIPVFSGNLEVADIPDQVSNPISAPIPCASPKPSSRNSGMVSNSGVRVELSGSHADRVDRNLIGRLGGATS